MLRSDWRIWRGDVYRADLGEPNGSVQSGVRPVVIIQNNVGNKYSPTVMIAPVTSNIEKKPHMPTHHIVKSCAAFKKPSMVLTEQVLTINKSQLQYYYGTVPKLDMLKIDVKILISFGLSRFLKGDKS